MNRLTPEIGRRRLLLSALASPLAICLPSIARAQTAAAFEVASIKPSAPGQHGVRIQIAPGGRLTASNVSVKMLIGQAYEVREFQISGGPGWLGSQHYDITAKAESDDNIGPEKLRPMMQALLADRFQLKFHRDTKEAPIYALVVAKNGPKLLENAGGGQGSQMRMGRGELSGQQIAMPMLANQLAQQLGRSVLDKTGLKGQYDIKLTWTPGEESQSFGPREGNPEAPPPDSSGPSIFTALQEQLGLKLESQKGPVELLIIDSIEKASDN